MSTKWTPKVEKAAALLKELDKVIVEYDHIKRQVLLLLIADQHGLLKSMPGLGKTMLVNTLQKCIRGSRSARLQMTPDMKPSDILGFEYFNPVKGEMALKKGPIVDADILLADEVNRTTAKTNSALLQGMQERKVMVGDQEFALSQMFLVLATINPAEMGGEGTFTLPEAMLDRFTASLDMDYISRAGEIEMLRRASLHGRGATQAVQPVLDVEDVFAMRAEHAKVVENTIKAGTLLEFIVDLVRSSRPGKPEFKALMERCGKPLDDYVKFGMSPRAEIASLHLACALAYLDGRDVATPDDVKSVFRDIARHRIIMKETAEMNDVTSDHVINEILGPEKGVPIIEPRAR